MEEDVRVPDLCNKGVKLRLFGPFVTWQIVLASVKPEIPVRAPQAISGSPALHDMVFEGGSFSLRPKLLSSSVETWHL